jgi:hypothetical protein
MLAARRWPVGPHARHVGMVLASHANRYGRAWPSGATLMDETGWSRATVYRSLEMLEAAELLERIHREGRACEYLFPQAVDLSHTETHPSLTETHLSLTETHKGYEKRSIKEGGAGRPRRLTAAADAEPIHISADITERLERLRRAAEGETR